MTIIVNEDLIRRAWDRFNTDNEWNARLWQEFLLDNGILNYQFTLPRGKVKLYCLDKDKVLGFVLKFS